MQLKTTLSALAIAAAAPAFADCDTITFSDVGWTDITATTAATTVVLDALGYETDIKIRSVPVTYTSLANKDVDVFLGNWMPTMEGDIAPYREAGTVDTVGANLEGAKYTLAVNKVAADLGITSFGAIAAQKDALEEEKARQRNRPERQLPVDQPVCHLAQRRRASRARHGQQCLGRTAQRSRHPQEVQTSKRTAAACAKAIAES